VRLIEVGALKLREFERRALKLRAIERRALKLRVCEKRPSKVCTFERRVLKTRAGKICPRQVGEIEISTPQVAAAGAKDEIMPIPWVR
jgi:hypothetical protein